jgi:hypothetical protein
MLIERMAAGDFYIICPDEEVARDVDNQRILWAADIIRNHTPLSRWHPDLADEFAAFLASKSPFRQEYNQSWNTESSAAPASTCRASVSAA